MKVEIDIKVLLQSIQSHNPGVDLTGLKAYLLDLVMGGGGDFIPVARPDKGIQRQAPPKPREVYEPHVEAEDDEENLGQPGGRYAEELSPFAPTQALTGDALEIEDGSEPEDPMAELARKAVGSVAPSRSAVKATVTGPKVRKSSKDKLSDREAKRQQMKDFSKMSGKEIMEQLTATTVPKRKPGQNQFIDIGDDGPPSDGDIEI